jgi:uncharacterized protein YndB with AHSA1/START domain
MLVVLAIPVVAIAYAAAAGPDLLAYFWWFTFGGFVCALAAAVILVLSLKQRLAMRGKPIDLRDFQRYQTTVVLLAAPVIAALGLSYAIEAPGLVLVGCVVAGGWVLLWSIPSLRRAQVVTSFVVKSPPEVVFAFVSDARNLPRWRPEYLSVELMTTEPIGPGSRFRELVKLPNGKEFRAQEEYVDFEPNRRFSSHVTDAPKPDFDEVTFEPVGDGTRVTVRFDFEHPFTNAVLGARLLQAAQDRQIVALRRAGEVRIKQILESGGSGA